VKTIDPYSKLKPGDLGYATAQSEALVGGRHIVQLHVKWDNGSNLILVKVGDVSDDNWEFIADDENGQSKCD
jgi:hypothetical protein